MLLTALCGRSFRSRYKSTFSTPHRSSPEGATPINSTKRALHCDAQQQKKNSSHRQTSNEGGEKSRPCGRTLFFTKYSTISNSLAAGALMLTGDVMCQTFEHTRKSRAESRAPQQQPSYIDNNRHTVDKLGGEIESEGKRVKVSPVVSIGSTSESEALNTLSTLSTLSGSSTVTSTGQGVSSFAEHNADALWIDHQRAWRMFSVGTIFNGPMYAWWYGGRLQNATIKVAGHFPSWCAVHVPHYRTSPASTSSAQSTPLPPHSTARQPHPVGLTGHKPPTPTSSSSPTTVKPSKDGASSCTASNGQRNMSSPPTSSQSMSRPTLSARPATTLAQTLTCPLSIGTLPYCGVKSRVWILSFVENIRRPTVRAHSPPLSVPLNATTCRPSVGNFRFLLLCTTIDCWLFNPMYTALFFVASEFVSMNVNLSAIVAKLKQEWLSATLIGGTVWFPIQLANFAIIPRHFSAVTVNVCNLIWSIFLSSRANRQLAGGTTTTTDE